MASMYGHRWTSAFGDEVDPDRVWQSTLKEITVDQIKHGMNRVAQSGSAWPPSAPEFRDMCTDADLKRKGSWEHDRIREATRQADEKRRKALEKPPMTDEQRARGSDALAGLRAGNPPSWCLEAIDE